MQVVLIWMSKYMYYDSCFIDTRINLPWCPLKTSRALALTGDEHRHTHWGEKWPMVCFIIVWVWRPQVTASSSRPQPKMRFTLILSKLRTGLTDFQWFPELQWAERELDFSWQMVEIQNSHYYRNSRFCSIVQVLLNVVSNNRWQQVLCWKKDGRWKRKSTNTSPGMSTVLGIPRKRHKFCVKT